MKIAFYALMSFMFIAFSGDVMAQGPPTPPIEMDEEAKLDELKDYREDLFKQKLKLTDAEAKEFFGSDCKKVTDLLIMEGKKLF